MKPITSNLWAIQTTFNKKKLLAFNYKNLKQLYWTSDKKSPVPALFETKKEALKALGKSNNCKERMPTNLFTRVYEGASQGKPVKVKVAIA